MNHGTRSPSSHTRTFLPRARNTGAAISWRQTTARTFSGKGSAASLCRRACFAAKSRAISGFKVSIASTSLPVRGAGERRPDIPYRVPPAREDPHSFPIFVPAGLQTDGDQMFRPDHSCRYFFVERLPRLPQRFFQQDIVTVFQPSSPKSSTAGFSTRSSSVWSLGLIKESLDLDASYVVAGKGFQPCSLRRCQALRRWSGLKLRRLRGAHLRTASIAIWGFSFASTW